jgi:hypothetical protein
MRTWVEPSAVLTNTVPPNDRLEATLAVTFAFDPLELAALRVAGGAFTIPQLMWFEEHDTLDDDTIGTTTATFTVGPFPGGAAPASVTRVFAPPSFVTTLAPNIGSSEGTTAEFIAEVDASGSNPETGQIWLTSAGAVAGGFARGPRAGAAGSTFALGAPQADVPMLAGARIYSVSSDGASFTINGFNDGGFTLALASSDLVWHPPEHDADTQFDPSVTFSDQYTNGTMTVGNLSSSGTVWALRGSSGDMWLSSYWRTAALPVLPADGESITVFPEDIELGSDALWVNFTTGSSESAAFLIVPATGSGGTIGDFVWEDWDQNGIQEFPEPGVAGVTVNLLDDLGNWLDSVVTDDNGFYSFSGKLPGDYQIEFVPPVDYIFTLQNQGTNEGEDSDADPSSGLTGMITVPLNYPLYENLEVDAGLVFAGGSGGFFSAGSTAGAEWDDADAAQETAKARHAGIGLHLLDGVGSSAPVSPKRPLSLPLRVADSQHLSNAGVARASHGDQSSLAIDASIARISSLIFEEEDALTDLAGELFAVGRPDDGKTL